METTVTKSERIIMASEQRTCDICGQPATSSCTDAVLSSVDGTEWGQAEPRRGCSTHPVKPQVIFKDGPTMTWEEYCAKS
jgi:hypothetical protein